MHFLQCLVCFTFSIIHSYIHFRHSFIYVFLDLDISSFILNIISLTYSFIYSFISFKHSFLFKIDNLLIISAHLFYIHPSISKFHLSLPTHSLVHLFLFFLSLTPLVACVVLAQFFMRYCKHLQQTYHR